ncbi:lipoprotein [Planoprotostelium fungivorum]|uniref:glucan endo-1,3-beta-D-glucosidase n=1 Tax=Planoprotostelium fungivorum TaxID=1890364 RepID=A0A2P6N053_9EUKA|nr:lipoprotein [Planoprotostelium fungivorum]
MRSISLLAFFFALCESAAIDSFRYTGVGASGSYQMITRADPGVWPNCNIPQDQKCGTTLSSVNAPLAPFDDEQSVVFRGPMNIYRLAVYQPQTGGAWTSVSYWDPNVSPQNLVFLNNMGGGASGTWSICQGASQSYSSGNYSTTTSKPNAEPFKTFIPPGKEVNIMTSTQCSTNQPCAGFSRGTAYHGWGGSKMFAIQYNMPQSTDSNNNIPAIWALNAQVLRSAQYGCNCRGMGGSGGCGELDLVEVIISQDLSQAYSEIYSMKGATGTGADYFARPYTTSRTLLVTFDAGTDTITLQHVASFDWSNSISAPQMSSYATGKVDRSVPFGTSYFTTSSSPTSNIPTSKSPTSNVPTSTVPTKSPTSSIPTSKSSTANTMSTTNVQQTSSTDVVPTMLQETGKNTSSTGSSATLSSSLFLIMFLAYLMM